VGGTETFPAQQWTKKALSRRAKMPNLGTQPYRCQSRNRTQSNRASQHGNKDTEEVVSPYSRATGLQRGQRRSNTRTGCQNQRCSLTKHRLDRYANPKLHHCKKPQTPNWKPAQSTKKTRPWKQTGRRARNRTPSSKIVSAPGDKVRAQNAPTCCQKSQLN
jgi:hypothetical protein